MSITLGWWLVPTLITLATIANLFWPAPAPRGYGDIGNGIVGMFQFLMGCIASLAAWLIWSIFA